MNATPVALVDFSCGVGLDHGEDLIVEGQRKGVVVGQGAAELGIGIRRMGTIGRASTVGRTTRGQVGTVLEGRIESHGSGGRGRSRLGSVKGQRRADGKVIGQGALQVRVTFRQGNGGRLDDPSGARSRVFGADSGRGEDVIEALAAGVDSIGGDVDGFALAKHLLAVLGPAPGIVDGVTRGAVLDAVELGRGDGPAAGLLGRMVGGAEGAVRVQHTPDIANGGVGGDEAMSQRRRDHVEVTEGQDKMAAVGGATEQLGHLPGLSGAMTCVGAMRVSTVGGVSLRGD